MNKVLFVIGLTKSGGAEKRAIKIAGLLKDIFDTKVFAFSGPKLDGVDFVFKDTYEEYKKYSKKERIKCLSEYIKEERPNIVISFLPHINFFTTKALNQVRNKNIKHVIAIAYYKHKFPDSLLRKYSIMKCDAIYFQCEDQKNYVKSHKPSFVIANPIDIKDVKEKDIRYRFMSAGRLEEQKDYHLQINAFNKLLKEYPNSILDIYGNGSLKDELNYLIDSLGLEKNVKIHEYTDNIEEEYANHDIFLFTTKAEGFPNALAEAMANRLICFTTHFVTGCDDLIVDNKTGFICKSRNDEEYAKMVCENLKDINKAKQIANNGYMHVKDICSTSSFVIKMSEELNKLIK